MWFIIMIFGLSTTIFDDINNISFGSSLVKLMIIMTMLLSSDSSTSLRIVHDVI